MALVRAFVLIVILHQLASSVLLAQSNSTSASAQLSEMDLRRIVIRLYDLGSAWAQVDAQRAALDAIEDQAARERAFHAREIELHQAKTALIERERDIEKARADFLEAKGKALARARGTGCVIKKILTVGLGRCH